MYSPFEDEAHDSDMDLSDDETPVVTTKVTATPTQYGYNYYGDNYSFGAAASNSGFGTAPNSTSSTVSTQPKQPGPWSGGYVAFNAYDNCTTQNYQQAQQSYPQYVSITSKPAQTQRISTPGIHAARRVPFSSKSSSSTFTSSSSTSSSSLYKPPPTTAAAPPRPPAPLSPPPSIIGGKMRKRKRDGESVLASTGGGGEEEWPDDLKEYVEKAFQRCQSDRERGKMSDLLKKQIQNAIKRDSLWDIDWSRRQIPNMGKKKGRTISTDEVDADEYRRLERKSKFQPLGYRPSTSVTPYRRIQYDDEGEVDLETLRVQGTCTDLEKKYYRLTSAPDPATVRPLSMLKKSLAHVQKKYKNGGDYLYTCEQLKSIRQDLMIQAIKNDFSVKVYETHARIALENVRTTIRNYISIKHNTAIRLAIDAMLKTKLTASKQNDFGEYFQCQCRAFILYNNDCKGSIAEFTAYRILFFLKSERTQPDLIRALSELTDEDKEEPCIAHALDVQQAVANKNYCKFFKLYPKAYNMGAYLMDKLVESMRIHALKVFCKAYRPKIETSYVTSVLAFDNAQQCLDFCQTKGAKISADLKFVLTKDSTIKDE